MAATSAGSRRILRVRGTVQGVGFRPFVYRTAVDLGLRGSVWNDADGVVIEAEGSVDALDERAHPLGRESVRVGTVTSEHAGLVVLRTEIGGSRVLERPYGELLPRIC